MKPLTKAIQDYLALRRSLGFKLRDAGRELGHFASFMEQRGAQIVTAQLALEWAQQPRHVQPAHWSQRLRYVRCFARHHLACEPRTEVPPAGLLPFRAARARPYLYSSDEIQRLLEVALQLPTSAPLRPWTFHALLGLLSVTLLKLFFHDLAQLGPLYRIGAFIGVAVIAMLASFAYQRFYLSSAKEKDAKDAAAE